MRVEKLEQDFRGKRLAGEFVQDKITGCVKDISVFYRVEFRSTLL